LSVEYRDALQLPQAALGRGDAVAGALAFHLERKTFEITREKELLYEI
jgi:hypothetical protein